MPVKELVEKYKGKPREALRRAVRAEYPGGDSLFNALILAEENRTKSKEWRKIYAALIEVREALFRDVAERYDFKSVRQENETETKEAAQNGVY